MNEAKNPHKQTVPDGNKSTLVSPENNTAHRLHKLKTWPFLLIYLICVGIVIAVVLATHGSDKKNKLVTNQSLAQVSVSSSGFAPEAVTVKAGTTVEWHSVDAETHIIASSPYPADNSLRNLKSPQFGSGATYRYTFTKTGSYSYHDDLHPSLNGLVIVK